MRQALAVERQLGPFHFPTNANLLTMEDRLSMARRHVREGWQTLARQRALVARKRALGFPTELSESLLASFEHSQAIFEDELAALLVQKTGGLV
jgi:hypothetical protein